MTNKKIRTDYKSEKKNRAMREVINIEQKTENFISRNTKPIIDNKWSGDWIGFEMEWSDNWFGKPTGIVITMVSSISTHIKDWSVSCNKADGKYIMDTIVKTLLKRNKRWDADKPWGDEIIRITFSLGDEYEIIDN